MSTPKIILAALLLAWTTGAKAQDKYVLLKAACAADAPATDAVFPDADHPVLQRVFLLDTGSLTARNLAGCIAYQEDIPAPVFLGSINDPAWLGAGSFSGGQAALAFIGAAEAWAVGKSRGPWEGPAALGLVDRWVDSGHADLAGRIRPLWMMDSSGFHGTAVAGLMAATTGNGIGLASLAGGLGAEQAQVRIRWQADPDRAVLEMARDGIGVVVAPWYTRCHYSPIQAAIYEEVEALGTLVVAGAGNGPGSAGCGDGHGLAYPASLPNVLSVSSVGHRFPRGTIDSVSGAWNWEDVHDLWPLDSAVQSHTHNAAVNLVAPGHGVWTTLPDDTYAQAWGTSFAAPLVGAAAAAVRRENPCLRPDEVREILEKSAFPIDQLPENIPFAGGLGAGRLDVGAALRLAQGLGSIRMETGSDTVWSGVNRIRDSLVVEAGATWTVRGRVYLDSAAFIHLLPGAKVVLDGAQLEPVCGQRWGGILVDGVRDVEPPSMVDLATGTYPDGPGQHALLTWDAETRILGADSAVVARWGGIVQGYGGSVVDAACALTIRHYPFPWPGLLRDVTYAWETAALDSVQQLVRLRHVLGVRFQGGTWVDRCDPPQGTGTGLAAENATFRLAAGWCYGGPCSPPRAAQFLNLARGIDAWTWFGALPDALHLADASFEGCYRSVRLSGYWLPLLERLALDMPAPGRWVDTLPTGVYLDACPGARVRDNRFYAPVGSRTIGLVLHASGLLPGQVERNRFTGFRQALAVLGKHGDSRDGWALRCNRFANNGVDVFLADAWSAPDGTAVGTGPSSLARSQGDCTSMPSANRYGDSGGWHLGLGAPRHTLFQFSGSAFRPKANDSLRLRFVDCEMPFDPTACIAPPVLPSAVPQDSFDQASLTAFQLALGLDNGDTESLLRLLHAPNPRTGFTQFLLSEAHPYFSDTVLLALLENYPDVSQPFFKELFLGNAPWTDRVYQEARTLLPDAAHSALEVAQGRGASPRDELFAASTAFRFQAARWRGIWYDTLASNRAISALPVALAHPTAFLAYFLANQAWSRADSLLQLPHMDTLGGIDFYRNMVAYFSAGRNLQHPHPALLAALTHQAQNSGWIGSMAKRLLRLTTQQENADAMPLFAEMRARTPSMSRKSSDRAVRSLVRIGPNPNPGKPLQVFGLPLNAQWMIWDMQGRLRHSGNAEKQTISMHGLPNGCYQFQWLSPTGGGSMPLIVLRQGG